MALQTAVAKMAIPKHVKYLIVGAGIHGLSTAYHLALELKARRKGDGSDILVVDKTAVGAGASGIACGVIRNNYFQPAMRELMAHSVEVWESDPKAYSYHPVGYMQISPEVMHNDARTIYEQQLAIGYESVFIEGEADSMKYMRGLFSDWQAKGVTSVLHEKKGGFANNYASMIGLSKKVEATGVRILGAVKVIGFHIEDGAVQAVETDCGTILPEQVVIGVGPWIKTVWGMLDLPSKITIRSNGKERREVRMWNYYCLQEGTLGVDPTSQKTNDGRMPPVIHVDTDAPLYSDINGRLITDEIWGLYYKPDFNFGGVQGGTMPYKVEKDHETLKIDPYGPKSPEFVVGEDFIEMWCSALAFCQRRFEGKHEAYRHQDKSGGLGALAPDSFPVFDVFHQNCYIIADSNHGYKMLGVGKLVAKELMGQKSALLEPFRFSRYAEGRLHPVSNSPFPWS